MSNTKHKTTSMLLVLSLIFTMFALNTIPANAATKKITLKASVTGQSTVYLTWNKISKPYSGYAVFRDGKVIKYCSKKTTKFTDRGLASGSAHSYQIKSYKKTKQYYNTKKNKWQKKKPKKSQWKGKQTRYVYSYKTKSNVVSIRTAYAYYTITWKDEDETTVLATTKVRQGLIPTYTGSTPTKLESDKYTYEFIGWTPEPVAVTGNATYIAHFRPIAKPTSIEIKPSQYNYSMRILNEPYGDGGYTAIYLETNNPNKYNYDLGVLDSHNTAAQLNKETAYYKDSTSTKYSDLNLSTLNGVVMICKPECTGNCKFVVYESDSNNIQHIVKVRSVYIKDYYENETLWMQSVINQTTNTNMTNKQKMQVICNYILDTFDYTLNDGEYNSAYIYLLKDEGIPYWEYKHTNSVLSPAMLVKFGTLLGYPLHNCYPDYMLGTDEWLMYHACAYSEADNEYYVACPDEGTGYINPNNIQTFNPSTYQYWGE